MARSDFVNHNWRVTVSGGIPVKVKKVGDGGVVGTVKELLGTGHLVFIRCELPGLVKLSPTGHGIVIERFTHGGATEPDPKLVLPWAEPLIQRVKGQG